MTNHEKSELCRHVTGFALASYPEHGETDGLTFAGDGRQPDTVFNFCPLCGEALEGWCDAVAANHKPGKLQSGLLNVRGNLFKLIQRDLFNCRFDRASSGKAMHLDVSTSIVHTP